MKNTMAYLLLCVLLLSMCSKEKHAKVSGERYACPMHPKVVKDGPGKCPICHMELVKLETDGDRKGVIVLTQNQMTLGNVTTAPAAFGNIGRNTLLNGKIVASPEQTEIISSRVAGRIEKVYFKETGVTLTKGVPLYEIYSEQLMTAQTAYISAVTSMEQRKDKSSEAFQAAAEHQLLLLGVSLEKIKQLAHEKKVISNVLFRAPVGGIIAGIKIKEGQYITPGASLYQIGNFTNLWVETEFYPGDLSLVKQGDEVDVVVNGFENQRVKGKVSFLNPVSQQSNQIMTARVEIKNSNGIFTPGMQAGVILVNGARKVITLPSDALIKGEKGNHVWVKTGKGTFEPRVVASGEDNADVVEVREGLREGEDVVISGAFLLDAELILKKDGDPLRGSMPMNQY